MRTSLRRSSERCHSIQRLRSLTRVSRSRTPAATCSDYDRTESRLTSAQRSAETAIALQPLLSAGHTALGVFHYARTAYADALSEFELAERAGTADSDLHRRIAAALRRQGQWDRAIDSFTRALDLDPLSPELERELAATLFFNRQYDQAIRHFDLSIAGAPNQVVAYWEKAFAQVVGSGSLAAAQATLTMMPKARDSSASGRAWVWLYTLQRDYTKALAAIDLLPAEGKVDQNDFLPRALIRANILRLMGRRDQARSQYRGGATDPRERTEPPARGCPRPQRTCPCTCRFRPCGRGASRGSAGNRALPAVKRRHCRSLQDRGHGTRRGNGRPV